VLKGNSFVSDLAGSKKTSEGKPGPTIGHALASTSFFDKENSRVLPATRPIKRIALRTHVYRPHGRREEPITQINPHRRLKVSQFRSMKRLDGAFSPSGAPHGSEIAPEGGACFWRASVPLFQAKCRVGSVRKGDPKTTS
jgi:hypothetical protein